MTKIFLESDKACKRSNKRSRTADIDTDKKICIISGKLRKENCGRNVTDKLAGKNTHKKRIFRKKEREKCVDLGDTSHISCENKEENKGQKQGIVNGGKCFSVHKHERRKDDNKTEKIRNNIENDRNRKSKKNDIYGGSCGRKTVFNFLGKFDLIFFNGKATNENKDRCNNKGLEHYHNEFHGGDREIRIKIKVLRVTERSEHTAKVCGDILENENERHMLFVAR